MFKRNLRLFILLVVLVSFNIKKEGQSSQLITTPQIEIVQADRDTILLKVDIPSYELTEEIHNGRKYHKLSLPETGHTTQPGTPQLPILSAILGVPPSAEISVRVLETETQTQPASYQLLPVPIPQSIDDTAIHLDYIPNQQAYNSDILYPATEAEIVEDGWLRDQRIARISLHPFQYNPAKKQLTWHKQMLIEVRFAHKEELAQISNPPDSENFPHPFDTLLKRSLLNYEQAVSWRARRPTTEQSFSPNSVLADTRYKIVVDQDGLYRLTYADMVAAGVPLTDPQNWQLTNLGANVAMQITGEQDGNFDPSDELIFYGEAFRGARFAERYPDEASIFWLLDNCTHVYCPNQILNYRSDAALQMEKYTHENVYWLEMGANAGTRMTTQDGTPSGLTPNEYYTTTIRSEVQGVWFTYPVIDTETWFWESASASAGSTITKTYPITLTALANVPVSATIQGAFVADTYSATIDPDHHTRVTLNEPANVIEDTFWDDIARHAFENQISSSLLQEGLNTLSFTILPVTGVASQRMYFDWYEVNYPRRFVAENDEIWFNNHQTGRQAFEIEELSSNQVWAINISQPLEPTLITNITVTGSGPYNAHLEANQTNGSDYFLTTNLAFKTPKSFYAYTPPDLLLPTNGADYIFITHHNFISPTQELADYRASQGMRTMVIDVDDVYNVFGDGIFNPVAIKNLLRYAYENWQPPAPTYVMLVGDGHFNFHRQSRYSGHQMPDMFMPPYLVTTDAWQSDVDSSNLLVSIVGDDALPDMLIGRAVVDTSSEMQTIVDKIIAYEAISGADWHQRLLFLADDTPDSAGDFVTQSEEVINGHVPNGYEIKRLYVDSYTDPEPPTCAPSGVCIAIRDDFVNSLNNEGALLVNYVGHGHVLRWATPVIFQSAYTNTLSNITQLPIVLDMTCLTGYWSYDDLNRNRPALAVEMVRHPNGGSIANFAPTSRGVSTGHDALDRGFYDAVFREEVRTLGEAALAAKLELFALGYNYDLLNTYEILGDPALRLPVPLHQVELSAQPLQQEAFPGETLTYQITITNTGTEDDTFTISTQNNEWPVTVSQSTIGPLTPNASEQFTVRVEAAINSQQGDSDTVDIIATSRANTYKSDSQALVTTINIIPGVSISPENAIRTGMPGQSISYTFQVANTGNFTDTFIAEVSHTWPFTLTSQTPFGPLAAGSEHTINAIVSIPITATNGSFNTSSLVIRSQNDPMISTTASARVNVNTTPISPGVNVSPKEDFSRGAPGEAVIYELEITNTGDYSDTFSAEIDSVWPITLTPLPPIGPFIPGEESSLTVSVQIPITVTAGEINVSTISFHSGHDTYVFDTTRLTTQVDSGKIYLPLIAR